MRKSDILMGQCQGGPWAAHTLASTNGLLWVPGTEFSCYVFCFDAAIWQWRNAAADSPFSPFVERHTNGQAADAAAPAKTDSEKVLAYFAIGHAGSGGPNA
jgi:hypothetical protein